MLDCDCVETPRKGDIPLGANGTVDEELRERILAAH